MRQDGERPIYITSWSGGKDSTASVILEHIHGLPPSDIIFSEVMFDKKRGISGELPEHMDFVKNKAIPMFESWGHKVEIIHADKDYLDIFFHVLSQSKTPERNGSFSGFPMGGMCALNSQCKTSPIKKYFKQFSKSEIIQYIGIAADKTKRLSNLEKRGQVSLLAKYGYTEQMAFDLCKQYNLLSSIYIYRKRGGCWFCPNQTIEEFAHLKINYPELWSELEKLSHTKNLVSQGFKYGKTFAEVDCKVNKIIEQLYQTAKANKEERQNDP